MDITIGKPSTESTARMFVCARLGHRFIANEAVTVKVFGDGSRGEPLCPHCMVTFMREMFRTEEIKPGHRGDQAHIAQVRSAMAQLESSKVAMFGGRTEVMESGGELGAGLDKASQYPVFQPCEFEGCRLAKHPDEVSHYLGG